MCNNNSQCPRRSLFPALRLRAPVAAALPQAAGIGCFNEMQSCLISTRQCPVLPLGVARLSYTLWPCIPAWRTQPGQVGQIVRKPNESLIERRIITFRQGDDGDPQE